MLSRSTLHGRLTLAYASALVVALTAFAALALFVLDDAQRRALDAQLATTSRAVLALVDASGSSIALEPSDRGQFGTIVGAKANSAIFGAGGTPAISSTYAIPSPIRERALAAAASTFATVEARGEVLRVFTAPVERRGCASARLPCGVTPTRSRRSTAASRSRSRWRSPCSRGWPSWRETPSRGAGSPRWAASRASRRRRS